MFAPHALQAHHPLQEVPQAQLVRNVVRVHIQVEAQPVCHALLARHHLLEAQQAQIVLSVLQVHIRLEAPLVYFVLSTHLEILLAFKHQLALNHVRQTLYLLLAARHVLIAVVSWIRIVSMEMELPVAQIAKSDVFAALLVQIVTQLVQDAQRHPHQLQ
jgi:hypothetical protein